MSTEPTTGETESEDTQITTSTEEVTDDDGTSTTGESSNEESSKTLSAEEKRRHVVDVFKKKLESGELKPEEIPDKQAWVLKEIEALKQEEATQPGIRELATKIAKEEAQKLIKEEQEKQVVQGLWDKVSEARPSKALMSSINSEFDAYKDSLGEKGALELAIRLSGLNISSEGIRRNKMFIPDNVGTAKNAPSHDDVILDQANQSDEALMKALRAKKGL